VRLPVTADLEHGYGLSAYELVGRTIDAGACGFNLEDTDQERKALVDIDRQADRLAAIKAAARVRGVDLVMNARIDVLFHGRSITEGVTRAERYLAAGADCVYPILLGDTAAIRDFVGLGPTNVLLRPGGASLASLIEAGAARISVGPFLFQ